MSTPVRRGFLWALLVTASLVVIGVFLQVYLIAVYILGGDIDALDAHKDMGGIVHIIEVLAFIAALVAFWGMWKRVAPAFALAVIGTLQLGLVDAGNEWVQGFHGLLALVVLILGHAVVQQAVRELGLGRHGRAPGAH